MTGTGPAASWRTPGGGRRWALRLGPVVSVLRTWLVVGALVVAYSLAPWDRWDDASRGSLVRSLALWLTAVVLAVVVEVRAVLRSAKPWLRALQAAVLSLVLLLLPFSTAYGGMSASDPSAFTEPLTRVDAVYFTVTVFATVGFGDIAPVSEPARILVTVQMLADLVLIGVIVKILVGAAQRRRGELGAGTRPTE